MSNRKELTEWFLGLIEKLLPGNKNTQMYKTHFNSLSDEAFGELMDKLADEEIVLPYYSANISAKDVPVNNALKVADELGLDLFQQLWMIDPVTGVKYLTPEKYLILDLPCRRQSQHVSKGKSVVESSAFVDALTGQPAGASKSSRLSLPEIMNLESMGLKRGIQELINIRGGNELAFREYKRSTLDTGEVSLKNLEELNSRPTSTETLKALLLGMHLDSNV